MFDENMDWSLIASDVPFLRLDSVVKLNFEKFFICQFYFFIGYLVVRSENQHEDCESIVIENVKKILSLNDATWRYPQI